MNLIEKINTIITGVHTKEVKGCMEKKFKLIPSGREGVYRIKALKSFSNVKKGDIGGYVQSENNLSQYGNCWIYDNAKVCGNAEICGNAVVCDNAEICGNAVVFDNAKVCGNAEIWEKAEVRGNAIISSDKDYIVFKNWWSSGRYFTWTRSNNMWSVGCFHGTGEELVTKAYADSIEKGREYERIVKYVEGEDKPSEWGIEDERNIRDCIFYLENAKKYFEKDDNILFNEKWFNLCIDWLKSLK